MAEALVDLDPAGARAPRSAKPCSFNMKAPERVPSRAPTPKPLPLGYGEARLTIGPGRIRDKFSSKPFVPELQTTFQPWKYDWAIRCDVKGLFDNIDHELLLRAVRKHVTCKWALLYIERWLTAPMERDMGHGLNEPAVTPQGGVISPILANLFMHYRASG